MKAVEIMNAVVYKIDDDKCNDNTVFVIHWEGHVYICEEMNT
jgi:hypothetical protein